MTDTPRHTEHTAQPSSRVCRAGDITIGPGHPLTVIGGPCVLESPELGLAVGTALRDACAQLGLTYIFKASFDKANRSSVASPRGPGLDRGLDWLNDIGEKLGVPVTTDIHSPEQAAPAAEVVALLQIPAFLCRQTDLLEAAGHAADDRVGVNVKKGQFLSPREMGGPVRKLHEAGCNNTLLTERGTFFGYHRLVNDFTGLGDLLELDCAAFAAPGDPGLASPPVCFDATHSMQLPGTGEQTGGRPERAPAVARAAVAAGVHALFLECHTDPSNAMSDASTQLTPEAGIELLRGCAAVRRALDELAG